jgi:hypothetical protein
MIGQTISGIKTFSSGIIPGSTQGYPNYELLLDFGGDAAGTWKRIVNVTSPNQQFSSIGFKIEITDPKANHATPGSVDNVITETYYVACVRTESTTLNTPDACYVRGPGNRIRATKTALGQYQIHIQNETQFREYRVNISVYAVNGGHTVTYHAGDTASAGTAQYNASISTTSEAVFQNLRIRAAASASSTTQIPVFTANPASTTRTLVTRTPAELRGDMSAAATNQTMHIGTTSVAINRASAAQTLTGVSIDGNAATVTNGVYTSGNQTIAGLKTFSNPELRIGSSNTENYISFRGTTGDGAGEFNHTFIGEYLYGGTESSELILFKGNDVEGTPGPDRIRLIGANHVFQTYNSALSGTFTAIASSAVPITRLIIRQNGNVGIGTIDPSELLHVNGKIRIGTQATALTDAVRADRSISTGDGLTGGGNLNFSGATTTANAANAFLNSGSTPANRIFRSTSSLRYKTEIEDIEQERFLGVLNLRPVWYRSLSEVDRSDWSWYGLIAEEVAEIEPRLVHWTYSEDSYEEIDGEQKLKADANLIPDGVQYERVTVLLLDVVKLQQKRIEALESKMAALETQ